MDDVPLSIVGFSLIATIGLMFLLKNYTKNQPSIVDGQQ
jgi:hypothetical protein